MASCILFHVGAFVVLWNEMAAAALLGALPPEIVATAERLAYRKAWQACNSVWGNPNDASVDSVKAEEYVAQMKEEGKGLFTTATVDEFADMAGYSGWAACGARRWEDENEQWNSDVSNLNSHLTKMATAGTFSDELKYNLRDLAWHTAWSAANAQAGFSSDHKDDDEQVTHFAKAAGGKVFIKSLTFDSNSTLIAPLKPKIVHSSTLTNSGDITQQMTFSFSSTQGSTSSYSSTLGFKLGVKTNFKCGFTFLAESKVEVSFEASFSSTWSWANQKSETTSYIFPLSVPAHSTYYAKAIVQQTTASVPYTLVYTIGGTEVTSSGIWQGVLVSAATCAVTPSSALFVL